MGETIMDKNIPNLPPGFVLNEVPKPPPGFVIDNKTGGGDGNFSFGKMLKNIPASAFEAGKDIYQAVAHPQQTKNALTGLMSGIISKAIPGKQEQEKYVDAMWDYAVERYGSVDNIQKTIETDPVGVAFDMSSIFTGLGGVARGAAKTGVKGAAKTGKILSKAGTLTDPLTAVGKVGKEVGKLITGKLPETMYAHAAGMPANMSIKDRIKAVRTGLKESIPLSQTGVDKLWTKINAIDDKVSNIISSGKYKTATVETMNGHIDEVIKFYEDVPDSATEIKYLNKLKEKNVQQFTGEIPVERAHVMKKKVYKQLKKAYDQNQPVKVVKAEGKMAFARGAMQELERLFPEIKKLNKKEGEYLNLYNAIEKAVPRLANQKIGVFNPFNLTIGGSVGYATNSAAAAVGALTAFLTLKDPTVQARLAILLNQTGRTTGKVLRQIPSSTGNALFQAGRQDDWSEYDNLQQ